MQIDLYKPELAGRKIKTLEDFLWLFARHVTYHTMQTTCFEEIYEERRNMRIGKKKLAFRGVGLDGDDEPVILATDKEGDYHFLRMEDLSPKDKGRIFQEVECLAEAINAGVILVCTTVYDVEGYQFIDVIHNIPDWSPDTRINFLQNAAFTGADSYAVGMTVHLDDTPYVIDAFHAIKGDHLVAAHIPGAEQVPVTLNLLLLTADEIDKIIRTIKEAEEKAVQESLARPYRKKKAIKNI